MNLAQIAAKLKGMFAFANYSLDSSGNAIGFINTAGVTVGRLPKQSGIPMILPSSGTMGANGALSAITALPTTYAQCYMYFPAGAVAAGSLAGLYYCVMSGTTAGTVYNNTYDPTTGILPTIPATLTAVVDAGPGAFTQTTGADISMLGVTIPAGAMGNSGRIHAWFDCSLTSTANNKMSRVYLGGTLCGGGVFASAAAIGCIAKISNRAAQNKQTTLTNTGIGQYAGGSLTYTSVDTTVAQTLTYTLQLAVATDYAVIETAAVDIRYGT